MNADKDEAYLARPGTLRPFFKHEGGKQQASCMIRAARVAAMLMFMEQDSVWLPPRRARAYDTDVLGHLAASRPGEMVTVVAKRWIDSFTGVMTLEDGSEVLVTAQVDSRISHHGEYTKVILIDCSNPLVATMKPEEVIAMLREPDSDVVCWKKHDEDASLDQESAGQADDYLDGLPPEMIKGLSKLHANETILHWLIKQAVHKASVLHVPGQKGVVVSKRFRQMSAQFETPAAVLEIFEPRLEKWTGGIVPDVICKARVRGSSDEPFDLLIEAAVHHKVGPEKLSKITELGIAAIEIRSERFAQVGAVKASTLAREICFNPNNKIWLFNPMLVEQQKVAAAELRHREGVLIAAEARTAAAAKWHSNASHDELINLAHQFCKAQWSGKPKPSTPHLDVTLESLRSEIRLRTGLDIQEPTLTGKGGLLAALSAVEDLSFGLPPVTPLSEFLESAKTVSYARSPMGPYLLLAMECWQPLLSQGEIKLAQELRAVIDASFRMGSLQHVRTKRLDQLVVAVFPKMGPMLEGEFGSLEYAQALGDEGRLIRRAEQDRAEEERVRAINADHELRLAVHRAQAHEKLQKLMDAEIDKLDRSTGWCVVTPQNRSLEVLVKHAQSAGIVNSSSIKLLDVVHSAWHARNEGRSVGDALRELRELGAKEPADLSFAAACWKRILMTRTTLV